MGKRGKKKGGPGPLFLASSSRGNIITLVIIVSSSTKEQ